MSRLIVDKRINENLKNALISRNHELIYTKEHKNLLKGIDTHPDMQIRVLNEKDIIVDSDCFNYYKKLIKDKNLIKSKYKLDKKYPKDISLNFVIFKNYLIHNLKYTEPLVLEYAKSNKFKLIDVKQGYTKCNILVGKNSLITSDENIYKKLKDDLKILLISHKQIKLENFEYGFIGGASGLVDGVIYFTGSLKNHLSYKKIIKFLNNNEEKYIFLTDDEITDYGTIIST